MNRVLFRTLVLLVLLCIVIFTACSCNYSDTPAPAPHPAKNTAEEEQTSPTAPIKDAVRLSYLEQEYGCSGHNRPLTCFRISNSGHPTGRKILCVFAIHGFEDAFYQDGRLLVDIAYDLIDYFKQHPGELGTYELLVVPCANPDGVNEGWTCNGPGRCQLSQGIDINMDFDYHFKVRTNPRNKTGETAFSSPEAQALRDLVLNEKPDVIIDFHGWVNSAAGDPELCEVFCEGMGVAHETVEEALYPGFFSGWAMGQARAVLVEFPDPFTGKGKYEHKTEHPIDYDSGFADKLDFNANTIACIKEIVIKNL